MIDFMNPFKKLITGFKSLLLVDDPPEENFFDALRQTLSEKDFKGSIYEIHHLNSQSQPIITNLSETSASSLEVSPEATTKTLPEEELKSKVLKRVMSAPNIWTLSS